MASLRSLDNYFRFMPLFLLITVLLTGCSNRYTSIEDKLYDLYGPYNQACVNVCTNFYGCDQEGFIAGEYCVAVTTTWFTGMDTCIEQEEFLINDFYPPGTFKYKKEENGITYYAKIDGMGTYYSVCDPLADNLVITIVGENNLDKYLGASK